MIEHVQFYQKQELKKDTCLIRCGYSLHHLEVCTNYTFMILTALHSPNRTSNLWKNLITNRKVDKHMSHVEPLCWQIVIHKVSLPVSIQVTGTHMIHTEHKLYSCKFHTTLAYQPLNNILSVLSIHIQWNPYMHIKALTYKRRYISWLHYNFNAKVFLLLQKQLYLAGNLTMLNSSVQFSITGYIRGLFKKYLDWNCYGCSLGGMCLQPVLTCSYIS
jgi:hypothetical protein